MKTKLIFAGIGILLLGVVGYFFSPMGLKARILHLKDKILKKFAFSGSQGRSLTVTPFNDENFKAYLNFLTVPELQDVLNILCGVNYLTDHPADYTHAYVSKAKASASRLGLLKTAQLASFGFVIT